MEVVEVRVGEQQQVNGREVLDLQSGALDALEKEKPVRKVRINEHVQVRELHQERRVADPRQRDLTGREFREVRLLLLAVTPGDERLPNHFAEKGPGIEVLGRSQFLERTRQPSPWARAVVMIAGFGIHVLETAVPTQPSTAKTRGVARKLLTS